MPGNLSTCYLCIFRMLICSSLADPQYLFHIADAKNEQRCKPESQGRSQFNVGDQRWRCSCISARKQLVGEEQLWTMPKTPNARW